MSSIKRLGASSVRYSWNPINRIQRARQQRAAARAQRQAYADRLEAQTVALSRTASLAPTLPEGEYAAPRGAASGSARWTPESWVLAPRQRGRATHRIRRGEGVSKRRYWKGIGVAVTVGFAAGVLILSAFHIALAVLAVGCIGLMGVLGLAAFRR